MVAMAIPLFPVIMGLCVWRAERAHVTWCHMESRCPAAARLYTHGTLMYRECTCVCVCVCVCLCTCECVSVCA